MEEDRKKINKNVYNDDTSKNIDLSEGEEDEIDQEEYKNQQDIETDIHDMEILNKVRLNMIQYCDYIALPLCDYLTHDAMHGFIEFLMNPRYV